MFGLTMPPLASCRWSRCDAFGWSLWSGALVAGERFPRFWRPGACGLGMCAQNPFRSDSAAATAAPRMPRVSLDSFGPPHSPGMSFVRRIFRCEAEMDDPRTGGRAISGFLTGTIKVLSTNAGTKGKPRSDFQNVLA